MEETDIIELEKRYWNLKAQSRTGRFDLETFKPNICPTIPEQLCEGISLKNEHSKVHMTISIELVKITTRNFKNYT